MISPGLALGPQWNRFGALAARALSRYRPGWFECGSIEGAWTCNGLVALMPVEFLTDDEAAACGRYAGSPSQADLERVFFLDDEDMDLVGQRRGEHMKAGFALQLVTARWLGTFLDDPLDVPAPVLEFVAGQLGVADPSVVMKYGE